MQLVRYDAACRALAECKSVDDAKDIADKATAMLAYARQAKSPDLELMASFIRIRAKRQIGILSKGLETSKGGANPEATLPEGGTSKTEALKAAGISKSEAHRCVQGSQQQQCDADGCSYWRGARHENPPPSNLLRLSLVLHAPDHRF